MQKVVFNGRNYKEIETLFKYGYCTFGVNIIGDIIQFRYLKYTTTEFTDKGENWSICAFDNMLSSLKQGNLKYIYLVHWTEKILCGKTQRAVLDKIRRNAVYKIIFVGE